jgi:hypothetical protein
MASNKSEDFSSSILPSTRCETDLSSDIDNLSNQIDTTFQRIEENANNSRIVYGNVLTSFDDWRIQELQRIDRIYQKNLRCIEVQQADLDKFCQHLLNDLKYNATQHLERVQKQENSNILILSYIQQTIARVKYCVANPKCGFRIQIPNDIELSSSNFPLIPTPVHKPRENQGIFEKKKTT